MPHPIENIMRSTMEELRGMVDVNTIVGNPIAAGNEPMILPVSKVSLGFLSGGGEYTLKTAQNSSVKKAGEALDDMKERYPFAGTSVAGMSLTPMAFLTVNNGKVKLLPAQFDSTVDRAIELIPEAVSLIEQLVKKKSSGTAQGGKQE